MHVNHPFNTTSFTILALLLITNPSLALPQTLPSKTASISSPPTPTTTPPTISFQEYTCLPSTSSFTSNTTTNPLSNNPPNTTIPFSTFTDKATSFCSQLGGEGMFGSKSVTFTTNTNVSNLNTSGGPSPEIQIDISFTRTTGGMIVEGDNKVVECVKMDGETCLRRLVELGANCATQSNQSGSEQYITGSLTHKTACGIYTVDIKSVTSSQDVGVPSSNPTVSSAVRVSSLSSTVICGVLIVFTVLFFS